MLFKACNNLNQGSTQSSLPTQPPASAHEVLHAGLVQIHGQDTASWTCWNGTCKIICISLLRYSHRDQNIAQLFQYLSVRGDYALVSPLQVTISLMHSIQTTHQLFLCALFRQGKHKHQTPFWNSNKFCLRSFFSSPSKMTWLLVLSSFPLLNTIKY